MKGNLLSQGDYQNVSVSIRFFCVCVHVGKRAIDIKTSARATYPALTPYYVCGAYYNIRIDRIVRKLGAVITQHPSSHIRNAYVYINLRAKAMRQPLNAFVALIRNLTGIGIAKKKRIFQFISAHFFCV